MVALKLMNFGAMLPAVDARLLPQNNAELSQNTWLYSGAIEGMPRMVPVRTLQNPDAKKAFRIPFQEFGKDNIPDSYWIELESNDSDIVASPSVGDSFERYYWAGLGFDPQYNTKARIAAGQSSYKLGIPAPVAAPSINISGGSAPAETRAYVYTWVSAYGEEGPPSPPILASGNASGIWTVTTTAPGSTVTAGRQLSHVRIYRTITGTTGSTTYYFVAEIAIGSTVYVDEVPTTTVAANNILRSTLWSEPPSDLKGMTPMPNGIIAGFRANEVWFCEPYRPHAWPSAYTLAVDGEIVGLGVTGQSLVVCTKISPYIITGVNPASMSISKIATNEPCLSRGSIVSTPAGVVFASPNGLILCAPGVTQNITRQIISKDLWLDQTRFLNLTSLYAATFNNQYYCWGTPGGNTFDPNAFNAEAFTQVDYTGAYTGAVIDIGDARLGYTKLSSELPTENCWTDNWTGEVLVIRDGVVYWLDLAPSRTKESFVWRSKVIETPSQKNIGAMRIFFDTYDWLPDLNPTPNASLVQELAEDQWGLVRIYADGVHRYTREIRRSGEIFRLPSGFKAGYWQVEIESRVKIYSVELASTAKELGVV